MVNSCKKHTEPYKFTLSAGALENSKKTGAVLLKEYWCARLRYVRVGKAGVAKSFIHGGRFLWPQK